VNYLVTYEECGTSREWFWTEKSAMERFEELARHASITNLKVYELRLIKDSQHLSAPRNKI
jgi:hypothetical protein